MDFIKLFITIIVSSCSGATGLSYDFDEYDLKMLCPLNPYCEQSQSMESDGTCCQKCTCDPFCLSVGTCCPGYEFGGNETRDMKPVYECVYPSQLMVSSAKRKFLQPRPENERMFRVVDSCPDLNTSSLYPACKHPTKLSDFIFVSDTSDVFVYRNSHCAACHGVFKTINWLLHISSCDIIVTTSFDTVKERNDYILENCVLSLNPPENTSVEIAECYDSYNVIKECNVSEEWDIFDLDLELRCLEKVPYQNTIFTRLLPRNKRQLYHNVYCYLCNIPFIDHARVSECDTNRNTSKVFGKGNDISFSALLDIRDTLDEAETSDCPTTYKWDKHTKACRRLYCSIGQMSRHGKCINFNLTGLVFQFLFEVTIKNGSSLYTSILYRLLEIIPNVMMQKQCNSICAKYAFKEEVTDTLYVSLLPYITDKCQANDILSNLKSLIQDGEIVYILKNSRETSVIILKATIDAPGDLKKLDIGGFDPVKCKNALQIKPTDLQTCPKFVFHRHELLHIGFNNNTLVTTNDFAIVSDQLPNVVSICVNNYSQILESISVSSTASPSYVLAVMIAVLLSMYNT